MVVTNNCVQSSQCSSGISPVLKPSPIPIQYWNKSLDELIYGSNVFEVDYSSQNEKLYRVAWDVFGSSVGHDSSILWKISKPCGNITWKKVKEAGDPFRYFIILCNESRGLRPSEKINSEDILQENVLDKGKIIAEGLGEFTLTPNDFPYYPACSLAIHSNSNPQSKVKQMDFTLEHIREMFKLSLLTNQYVGYNSLGGGATRPERLHFQVVDPSYFCEPNENEPLVGSLVDFPIIDSFKKLGNGSLKYLVNGWQTLTPTSKPIADNYFVHTYGIDISGNPEGRAEEVFGLMSKLRDSKSTAFNLLITGKNAYVFERTGLNKSLPITNGVSGCLEMSGILIESSKVIDGLPYDMNKAAKNTDYETIWKVQNRYYGKGSGTELGSGVIQDFEN